MEQQIMNGRNRYEVLNRWLDGRKILVVCGHSYRNLNRLREIIDAHKDVVYFSDFSPNPVYESVVRGVEVFNNNDLDSIVAVGGGSAIDVAKCIKLYSALDPEKNYLEQEEQPSDIPLLAIPTTAGTGSEATSFAVIYYNGDKRSVTSDQCLPEAVLLDPDNLRSLPLYQRKSTMLDALSHAVESMWSVNSNEQSREYSKDAIRAFVKHYKGYLENTDEGDAGMQMAAYNAGRAINISKTTAGHAMCYKITSMFGCAHGHAAMMCNRKLFPWMIEHKDLCSDTRGIKHLMQMFDEIADALGCRDAQSACKWLEDLYVELDMDIPKPDREQMETMVDSVNPERLMNNPVSLDREDIKDLYKEIFEIND